MSRDGTTLVYETSSACSYEPNSTHILTQLILSILFGISCLKINTYWQILENSSRKFSEISVFRVMSQTRSDPDRIIGKLVQFLLEIPIFKLERFT